MTWQLNALVELHWRSWDGEWAVFDVGSGQTHHMDTLSAVTLMVIEAQQIELPNLLVHVANELQLTNNPELSTAVDGILEKLAVAGLITTVHA